MFLFPKFFVRSIFYWLLNIFFSFRATRKQKRWRAEHPKEAPPSTRHTHTHINIRNLFLPPSSPRAQMAVVPSKLHEARSLLLIFLFLFFFSPLNNKTRAHAQVPKYYWVIYFFLLLSIWTPCDTADCTIMNLHIYIWNHVLYFVSRYN